MQDDQSILMFLLEQAHACAQAEGHLTSAKHIAIAMALAAANTDKDDGGE